MEESAMECLSLRRLMMEKGLQAVYSGYIAGNGTTISKSKKEGIHGMQWSVNARSVPLIVSMGMESLFRASLLPLFRL